MTNDALVVAEGIPPWLERILGSLPRTADGLYMFTAVLYVLMYESGFMTQEGPENLTSHFDARVMKQLESMTDVVEEGNSLKIKFYLYPHIQHCLLIVTKVEDLFIVNLYVPSAGGKVITVTYNTDHHFKVENGVYTLQKLEEVSLSFKSKLETLRCTLKNNAGDECTFCSIPYELKAKICTYLTLKSFGKLTLTCRSMFLFQEDDHLLKKMLSLTYDASHLPDKGPNETWSQCFRKFRGPSPAPFQGPATTIAGHYTNGHLYPFGVLRCDAPNEGNIAVIDISITHGACSGYEVQIGSPPHH